MDDLTGSTLGDFQLLRLLGRGAMAAVYLAEQRSLARRVAVKVLAADLCRDQAYVERFLHEARSAASLVHSGIVQVHEVGSAPVDGVDRHYIAQEYVAGGSLGRLVQRDGALAPSRVLEVMWQVGSALAAASEVGLVHRDIKPDNLMVDRSGAIKVADFGLARLLEANSPRMTQAGVAMGTPLYMSPEQIEGGDVDPRSDLYSLGVTAYQLLTGSPPFTGDTPLAVAVKHLNTAPDPVASRRAGVPAALAAVIDRLIAKKPGERYGSPAELLGALADTASAGQSEGWYTSSGGLGSGAIGASTITGVRTPRSDEDVAAVRRLSDAMQSESQKRSSRRGRAKRVTAATAIGLLIGAVLGGAIAPRPLLWSPDAQIERFDTAKQQLFHAKNADTPDAWRAVLDYHPETDAFYQRLALRGLALCLLRRDEPRGAANALERISDQAEASGDPDYVVAAARVVAYDRLGEADKARTAGARLSAAPERERARLEELVPELYADSLQALERLN